MSTRPIFIVASSYCEARKYANANYINFNEWTYINSTAEDAPNLNIDRGIAIILPVNISPTVSCYTVNKMVHELKKRQFLILHDGGYYENNT